MHVGQKGIPWDFCCFTRSGLFIQNIQILLLKPFHRYFDDVTTLCEKVV